MQCSQYKNCNLKTRSKSSRALGDFRISESLSFFIRKFSDTYVFDNYVFFVQKFWWNVFSCQNLFVGTQTNRLNELNLFTFWIIYQKWSRTWICHGIEFFYNIFNVLWKINKYSQRYLVVREKAKIAKIIVFLMSVMECKNFSIRKIILWFIYFGSFAFARTARVIFVNIYWYFLGHKWNSFFQ